MTELTKEIADRKDVPADVKASFDSFSKELTAFAPKFAAAAGGRGGGGGAAGGPGAPGAAAQTSVLTRIGQAKNGLMGGMSPTEQVTKAYNDSKAQAPKAFADANALFAKAATLSAALAKYNLKLDAPKPVAVPGPAPKK